MTLATAYACILVCVLLPYVWVGVAKAAGGRYDNRDPRQWIDRQDRPRVLRAHAAHLNAFEAFAPFAAGVVVAQLAGVAHGTIAALSVAFVAFRIAHGVAYLAGLASVRSLVWVGGLGCVVALYTLAIGKA